MTKRLRDSTHIVGSTGLGWDQLPDTFFPNLAVLDSASIVRCMRVCKRWHRQIKRVPWLLTVISMHRIEVETQLELQDEVSMMHLKAYQTKKIDKYIAEILLRVHNFNVNVFYSATQLLYDLGWRGESEYIYIEKETGDVVFTTDAYDWRPVPVTKEDIPKFDGMRLLEKTFPGTFTWKLILYPWFHESLWHRHTTNYNKGSLRRGHPERHRHFHRGSCFLIRIKANGLGLLFPVKGKGRAAMDWKAREKTMRPHLTHTEKEVAQYLTRFVYPVKINGYIGCREIDFQNRLLRFLSNE